MIGREGVYSMLGQRAEKWGGAGMEFSVLMGLLLFPGGSLFSSQKAEEVVVRVGGGACDAESFVVQAYNENGLKGGGGAPMDLSAPLATCCRVF